MNECGHAIETIQTQSQTDETTCFAVSLLKTVSSQCHVMWVSEWCSPTAHNNVNTEHRYCIRAIATSKIEDRQQSTLLWGFLFCHQTNGHPSAISVENWRAKDSKGKNAPPPPEKRQELLLDNTCQCASQPTNVNAFGVGVAGRHESSRLVESLRLPFYFINLSYCVTISKANCRANNVLTERDTVNIKQRIRRYFLIGKWNNVGTISCQRRRGRGIECMCASFIDLTRMVRGV